MHQNPEMDDLSTLGVNYSSYMIQDLPFFGGVGRWLGPSSSGFFNYYIIIIVVSVDFDAIACSWRDLSFVPAIGCK